MYLIDSLACNSWLPRKSTPLGAPFAKAEPLGPSTFGGVIFMVTDSFVKIVGTQMREEKL
jgi:hypothetical protein